MKTKDFESQWKMVDGMMACVLDGGWYKDTRPC